MIDRELAAFLEEGIGIEIGTRNAHLEPSGARVIAVLVEDDGRHVVAYVPDPSSTRVLPDLESNGHVALVCARPPDERACQLKGLFAGARAAADEERALVEGQWARWLDRLTTIGFARETFAHWSTWPCTAVRMRVTDIFNQTPGPGAGARLK